MPQLSLGGRNSTYSLEEVTALEIDADAQEAFLLATVIENEEFTFNESVQDEEGGGAIMDNDDGVVAQLAAGTPKRVRVLATVVVDEGTTGAVEADFVEVQLYVNEVLRLRSENGFETDTTEAAVTFTIDKHITILGGDIIRLALSADAANEAGSDYDIAAAGEFDLIIVGD